MTARRAIAGLARPASSTWPPWRVSRTRPCPGSSTGTRACGRRPGSMVLAAIEELGFRPNRAARVLRGSSARSVTVLTSNTSLYGYQAALQGIEEAARAAGFAVGVRVVDSPVPAEVAAAVKRAIEPGGSVIVIAHDRTGTMALEAVPPEIPMTAMIETPAVDPGPETAVAVARRQEGGRRGDPLPAVTRPPDGALPGHPLVLADQPAAGWMAGRPGGGGGADARAGAGRLDSPLRLPVGTGACGRSGGDRGALRQRRPGPRPDARGARRRAFRPRRRERGGLRRYAGRRVPDAAADHGPAGLHRTGPGLLHPAPGTHGGRRKRPCRTHGPSRN